MKEVPAQGRLRLAVLGALFCGVALLGTGCLVVPVPTNRLGDYSRKDIKPEVMANLVVGVTTREDVLLCLGEPDVWNDQTGQYRYHWERVKWDIFWAVGGGYNADGGDIPVNKNYDLIVSFDRAGVVSGRNFSEMFQESELEKGPPTMR